MYILRKTVVKYASKKTLIDPYLISVHILTVVSQLFSFICTISTFLYCVAVL